MYPYALLKEIFNCASNLKKIQKANFFFGGGGGIRFAFKEVEIKAKNNPQRFNAKMLVKYVSSISTDYWLNK
jgi:hypothetical protein